MEWWTNSDIAQSLSQTTVRALFWLKLRSFVGGVDLSGYRFCPTRSQIEFLNDHFMHGVLPLRKLQCKRGEVLENNTQYTAKVKQNKKSKKSKTVLSTRFQPVKSSGKTRTEFPHPTS